MKNLKLVIFILTLFSISSPAIAANLLANTVTISLYNVQTQQPQNTFLVGDTVGYIITAALPESVQSQKATITVTLSAKIHGIDLPIKLSQTLTAPVTSYDKTTQTTTNLPTRAYIPTTKYGQFIIPKQVAGSEITISAKVSVAKVGSITKKASLAVQYGHP